MPSRGRSRYSIKHALSEASEAARNRSRQHSRIAQALLQSPSDRSDKPRRSLNAFYDRLAYRSQPRSSTSGSPADITTEDYNTFVPLKRKKRAVADDGDGFGVDMGKDGDSGVSVDSAQSRRDGKAGSVSKQRSMARSKYRGGDELRSGLARIPSEDYAGNPPACSVGQAEHLAHDDRSSDIYRGTIGYGNIGEDTPMEDLYLGRDVTSAGFLLPNHAEQAEFAVVTGPPMREDEFGQGRLDTEYESLATIYRDVKQPLPPQFYPQQHCNSMQDENYPVLPQIPYTPGLANNGRHGLDAFAQQELFNRSPSNLRRPLTPLQASPTSFVPWNAVCQHNPYNVDSQHQRFSVSDTPFGHATSKPRSISPLVPSPERFRLRTDSRNRSSFRPGGNSPASSAASSGRRVYPGFGFAQHALRVYPNQNSLSLRKETSPTPYSRPMLQKELIPVATSSPVSMWDHDPRGGQFWKIGDRRTGRMHDHDEREMIAMSRCETEIPAPGGEYRVGHESNAFSLGFRTPPPTHPYNFGGRSSYPQDAYPRPPNTPNSQHNVNPFGAQPFTPQTPSDQGYRARIPSELAYPAWPSSGNLEAKLASQSGESLALGGFAAGVDEHSARSAMNFNVDVLEEQAKQAEQAWAEAQEEASERYSFPQVDKHKMKQQTRLQTRSIAIPPRYALPVRPPQRRHVQPRVEDEMESIGSFGNDVTAPGDVDSAKLLTTGEEELEAPEASAKDIRLNTGQLGIAKLEQNGSRAGSKEGWPGFEVYKDPLDVMEVD